MERNLHAIVRGAPTVCVIIPNGAVWSAAPIAYFLLATLRT
jgi:hypothetical protein